MGFILIHRGEILMQSKTMTLMSPLRSCLQGEVRVSERAESRKKNEARQSLPDEEVSL